MTHTGCLLATSDNEIGKNGSVPKGCGRNRAILRSRPRLWARHSLRTRPSLARFPLATPSIPVVLTGPRGASAGAGRRGQPQLDLPDTSADGSAAKKSRSTPRSRIRKRTANGAKSSSKPSARSSRKSRYSMNNPAASGGSWSFYIFPVRRAEDA